MTQAAFLRLWNVSLLTLLYTLFELYQVSFFTRQTRVTRLCNGILKWVDLTPDMFLKAGQLF